MQDLTAEAAAARHAAATAEAETTRVRGKSEDIQRKARLAPLSQPNGPVTDYIKHEAQDQVAT